MAKKAAFGRFLMIGPVNTKRALQRLLQCPDFYFPSSHGVLEPFDPA
jgi:hypothetical protein